MAEALGILVYFSQWMRRTKVAHGTLPAPLPGHFVSVKHIELVGTYSPSPGGNAVVNQSYQGIYKRLGNNSWLA